MSGEVGNPRWQKGQSGNPSGRPKENEDVRLAKELARAKCPDAIRKLVELMDSADDKVKLAACNSVLDRGIGKAMQQVEHTGQIGFFDMLATALLSQQGENVSGIEAGAPEGSSGSIQ